METLESQATGGGEGGGSAAAASVCACLWRNKKKPDGTVTLKIQN